MSDARTQAQIRALTREVGTLKEELQREVKKRERLAVRAKECEVLQTEAESQVRSLTYVNNKLEQELSVFKDRPHHCNSQAKNGLESLRERLLDIEKSVSSRSIEAQKQLQQVRCLVQELASVTTTLSAASAVSQKLTKRGAILNRPVAVQTTRPLPTPSVPNPTEIQQRFTQVFAGLNLLSECISGRSKFSEESQCNNHNMSAPLLLTAPNATTKSIRWQTNASSGDAERAQLQAQVQELKAELSLARSKGIGSSKLIAAVQKLEAVVPQYKAVALALQGQISVMKEKLAAVSRDRSQLQEEVGRWRSRAQELEAAYADATAKVHAKEAQAMALSSQAQTHSDKLESNAETLRQRCSDLGVRLRGAQQETARLRAMLSERDKLINTQQGTIRRLEATIADQQEDICSALDLVTSRNGGITGATDVLLQQSSIWNGLEGGVGASPNSPVCTMEDANVGEPSWSYVASPGNCAHLGSIPGMGQNYEPWTISTQAAAGEPALGYDMKADSGGYAAVSVSPRCHASPGVASHLDGSLQADSKQQRLECSLPRTGGASVEAEIADLEDALRHALTDLNI